MPARTQPRLLRRVAKAAVTLLAVAIIVLALPLVLAIVVGVPVPQPFTTHQVFAERGVFDLIVVIVWLLWAANVVLLVRSTIAQLRDHGTVTRAPGYINRLAVKLAGACLVISTLWGGAAGATPAPVAARTAPTVSAAAPSHLMGPVAVTAPAAPAPPAVALPPAPAPAAVVTVQEGQSLWTIAEQLYGSGADWELLANANLGHVMNDGLRFTDPNLVYPGWQLSAPALDTPAATPAPPPAPAPASVVPPATAAAPAIHAPPLAAPTTTPAATAESGTGGDGATTPPTTTPA